jgi:RHS repeat-associated protein
VYSNVKNENWKLGALQAVYTHRLDRFSEAYKEIAYNGTTKSGQQKQLLLGAYSVINFEYDELYGWQKEIEAKKKSGDLLMHMKLNYNETPFGGASYYNGIVNSYEIEYPQLSGVSRNHYRYTFSYDKLLQLKEANYRYKTTGWSAASNQYRLTNLNYDENGNILTMKRYNEKGGLKNDFYHTYNAGTNQLAKRSYTANTEFAYHLNGSITKDAVNYVQNIGYHYLELPETITVGFGADIALVENGYDDEAHRLYKKNEGRLVSQYIYGLDGGVIAEYDGNNDLKMWSLGGFGYKTGEDTDVDSYYYIKDHIGNIRVTINEGGNIMGKDDYYPFGLRMAGLSYNNGNENDRLKFSGKELDEEQGLKKYHFGWRDYDPELGRWNVADPARQYASPYVAMANNPICYYDPNGLFGWSDDVDASWNKAWGKIYAEIGNASAILTLKIISFFTSGGLENPLEYLVAEVVSSMLPSYEIGPFRIGPSFLFTPKNGYGFGIDLDVTIPINSEVDILMGFSIRGGKGFVSRIPGLEVRRSLMVRYGNWSFGVNNFRTESGITDQNTWMVGWSDGRWSAGLENDMLSGTDMYRTAAAHIGYNNGHGVTYTAGLTLYTGDPGQVTMEERSRSHSINNPKGVYNNITNEDWKLGAWYGGVRDGSQIYQVGANAEWISHFFQNWLFHRRVVHSPDFPYDLSKPTQFYYNHSSYTPYTYY